MINACNHILLITYFIVLENWMEFMKQEKIVQIWLLRIDILDIQIAFNKLG